MAYFHFSYFPHYGIFSLFVLSALWELCNNIYGGIGDDLRKKDLSKTC